jgi:VIT1/CCC1 family predicted Fe2+/Mn2+ transporter
VSEGLDERVVRLVERFCREEARAFRVYRLLAELAGDEAQRRVLERLAEQERRHYEFWRGLLGRDCDGGGVSVGLLRAAYRVLGPVFVLQLLERGEEDAVRAYREFMNLVDNDELRRRVEEIMREEEEHEKILLQQVEDVRVKYMGFIALGLADAIVEITGVHAGFLGATSNTLLAGIAGLVVGFSAALSMAGAAYLQAKHGGETHPPTSALVTGLSYIFSVVLLALPYFLTRSMLLAFSVSLSLAVALIAAFTYYSVVVQGKSFTREFTETTLLMLGTAFGSFLFGRLLGGVFGIEHI